MTETVHVVLPDALVALFPGSLRRLDVEAGDVGGMIGALNRRWPGMGGRIADSRPAIRKHINIFVDGERAEIVTPLKPGTTVFVLTAISGG
jgi:sulfur-carrier protein